MSRITGIFNILATPFTESGALDIDSLKRLVRFQMSLGVDGLTILGVLGEAAKLNVDERRQVMETVLATVDGAIPVVVGTSHPDSAVCIRLSQEASQAAAAGVMIAPPPLEDKSQANIIRLYAQIAEAIGDVAIVAQDYPKINDVLMPADTLAALADAVPTVRHLKLEDPPLMQKVSAIFEHTDKLQIFGGLGGMFLLEELQRGSHGTMTGFAFSEILIAVFQAHKAGDSARAAAIFDRYLPLIRYENQPEINLPIRKELLRLRGAIDCAALRQPFNPIDTGTYAEIDRVLARVGISDPTVKITFD